MVTRIPITTTTKYSVDGYLDLYGRPCAEDTKEQFKDPKKQYEDPGEQSEDPKEQFKDTQEQLPKTAI